MNKDQQDKAWACLTSTQRIICSGMYKSSNDGNVEFLLDEIFGKHNLTSDTEPDEMLCVNKEAFDKYYTLLEYNYSHDSELYDELYWEFVKCLPDKEDSKGDKVLEALENYRTTATPEQKANDLLKLEAECISDKEENNDILGQTECPNCGILRDTTLNPCDCGYNPKTNNVEESHIQTNDMKPCPYTDGRTCKTCMGNGWCDYKPRNMEEKELNLCELLKGCEGEEFYSLNSGIVEYQGVNPDKSLLFVDVKTDNPIYITLQGFGTYGNGEVCLIFPTRALFEKYPLDPYSAWMEWKEARVKSTFVVKVFVGEENSVGECVINEHFTFHTKEEAQQAAEGIREYLQKFHEKNNNKINENRTNN